SFSELSDLIRGRLPSYMVPTAWVEIAQLPRTPSGKVDRQALPTGQAATDRKAGNVAARNAEEELLVQIWSDILAIESVGVFDDFFELGGHSLMATQLVSRIREVLGLELSLRQFFDQPTIAETA